MSLQIYNEGDEPEKSFPMFGVAKGLTDSATQLADGFKVLHALAIILEDDTDITEEALKEGMLVGLNLLDDSMQTSADTLNTFLDLANAAEAQGIDLWRMPPKGHGSLGSP